MNPIKTLSLAVALAFSSFVLSDDAEATTVVISDGTFAEADWDHVLLTDTTPGGGAFTAFQAPSGGSPGSYQQGSQSFGPGTIRVGHLFSGAPIYDPSVHGPIEELSLSFDFNFLEAFPEFSSGNSIRAGLLLFQDGAYYAQSGLRFDLDDPAGWTSGSQIFLDASDLSLVTATGLDTNSHPDFSENGAPIVFGFHTLNGTNRATGQTTTWGFDNYNLVVVGGLVVVPEPRTAMLLITALVTLAVRRRVGARR